MIVSNPCFEIWLYFGKFANKPNDFIIPENSLKISQCFKRYLGNKVHGGVNPKHAIFDINRAMQNAKKLYEEDENGLPSIFSTNMYQLSESILPLIKDELDNLSTEEKQYRSQ